MIEQFKSEVKKGLNNEPKTLPSKYFYNEIGDQLFQKIMNLPEYYLTRSELEIFQEQSSQIVHAFDMDKNQPFELIELGAGDGTKTIEILKKLVSLNYQFSYLPIDISDHALEGLISMLKQKLPTLNVVPKQGTYFNVLSDLKTSIHPKVILFLGSNIGNLLDEDAKDFMYQLGSNLQPNDKILLGVDRIKAKEIVLPAYNDSQGVTAAFNLNLLTRINDELGADFELSKFEHCPEYEVEEGIAKSFIKSKIKQSVYIQSLNQSFNFEANEKIHTEISRKYNDNILNTILAKTDLTIETKFTDTKKMFFDYILKRN
ncbi:MAG: L-histidine N(alpha)-methyltransferase [Crocinitomicaceae bacterium]